MNALLVTLAICVIHSAADDAKPAGSMEVDGKPVTLYFNPLSGEKYFLDDNGEKNQLGEHLRKTAEARWRKQGRFSKELADAVERTPPGKTLDVEFEIEMPPEGRKLTRQEYLAIRAEEKRKALELLGKELPGARLETTGDHDGIRARRVPPDLLGKLKYSNRIGMGRLVPAEGESGDFPADRQLVHEDLEETFGGVQSPATGLNLEALRSQGYEGQGIRVGYVEGHGITPGDGPAYFTNPSTGALFVSQRPGTVYAGSSTHNRYTISTLRSAHGPNQGFGWGGARSAHHVYYAPHMVDYKVFGIWVAEPDLTKSYNWVTEQDGASVSIVNSSFSHHRWNGSWETNAQNKNDKHWDIKAASYPYALNVISAGNEGDNNRQVNWWGHNHIIVGSANAGGRAPSSSFLNGARGDEVPHVVSDGIGVRFPDGSVKSGTSYAAPAITAMAATLQSKYGQHVNYPELFKAAILGSAAPRYVTESYTPYRDTEAGFGFPEAGMADRILAGFTTDYTLRNDAGSALFSFYSSDPVGTIVEKKLYITPPSYPYYLHVIITWFSNPDGTCAAEHGCWADDLDLVVTDLYDNPHYWSTSGGNTTERVQMFLNGIAPFKLKIKLFARSTNKTIYGAISYRTTTQRVPIHGEENMHP